MRLPYSNSSEHSIHSYHPNGFMDSLLYDVDALSRLLEENINRLLGIPKRLNLPEEDYMPPELLGHSVGHPRQQSQEYAMPQEASAQVQLHVSPQHSPSREAIKLMDLMLLDCP